MAWRSQLRRPLIVSAAALTTVAVGGAVVYNTNRSRGPRFSVPIVPVQRNSHGALVPPTLPSAKSRAEQLADLRRSAPSSSSSSTPTSSSPSDSNSEYDLLVIGGGATGTGIALDAATRGLKVALVERDDFSAGTSSKSTKLVHGGVRYLEKAVWQLDYGQFELVMEALGERKTFLDIAPHLARELPILLPVQHWWQAPYFWAGTKAYDLLAAAQGQGLSGSYWMSRRAALQAVPRLRTDTLVGGLVYYDGQQNDSRTNVALALTAMLHGATVVNHVEVTALEKDASGRICGARVRDVLDDDATGCSSSEFVVRAKGVINATGPFADGIEHLDDPKRPDRIAPSSGAHIVLPGALCPNGMGLLEASTSDGRVVFVLPWEGYTLAGTTDNPCALERQPAATGDDVDFILREVSKLLRPVADGNNDSSSSSSDALTRKDILATWSGIRPLVRNPHAANTESLVRSHLVTVSPSGLLTCAGGKWTTYRQMAQDAVDDAIRAFGLTPAAGIALGRVGSTSSSHSGPSPLPTATTGACITKSIPLVGAHGYSPDLPAQLREAYPSVDADIVEHLAANYGDRAWSVLSSSSSSSPLTRILPACPITDAEVRYGVRAESACTAVDVLARRTRLAFLDVHAAHAALPRVIDILASELHWSNAVRDSEFKASVAFLQSMGLEQVQAAAAAASTATALAAAAASIKSAESSVAWEASAKM